jgi:hypothetical protein
MHNTDDKNISKSTILARLIYKAIVRYVKAKKSLMITKNPKFSLDINRIWRGNIQGSIDELEKNK